MQADCGTEPASRLIHLYLIFEKSSSTDFCRLLLHPYLTLGSPASRDSLAQCAHFFEEE